MRRLSFIPFLLLIVEMASAAEEGAAPRLRIATFDLGRVEAESDLVRDGKDRIEREFAAEKAAFEKLQAEFRRMVQDLRSSIYRPGSPEHREQVARVRAKEGEVKETGTDLFKRIQEAKSELLARMYADLRKAVETISEKEGYDLVFQVHRPSPRSTALDMVRQLNAMDLFHAHPRFDITDRIIAALSSQKPQKPAKPEK